MHGTVSEDLQLFFFHEKHYNGVATSDINLKHSKISVNILCMGIALGSLRKRLQLDQYK